jgi:hypothetical protein
MDNKTKDLFVIITTGMGMWIGRATQDAYDSWTLGNALQLRDARGLIIRPEDAQRVSMNIGPIYPGDTPQTKVDVFPTSVEVLGEIKEENGTEYCSDKNQLFNTYLEAVLKWKSMLSNLTIAGPEDLKNIKPFPQK